LDPKILVVEDDFANQQVATLFLKKFGYQAEVAENGAIAASLAQQHQYQLILMDCQMPIMDGFTATKAIRMSEGPNQNTPIIALTANLVSGIKVECKDCGMNDILYKPVAMNAMKAMVDKWIDQPLN
jgi:CheY-like chemotaxis protein